MSLANANDGQLLGAHMSIAGGLPVAIERAKSVGCSALQVFLKNNNQWAGRRPTRDEIEQWHQDLAASRVRSVFAHASYLVNLATGQAALREKSVGAMIDEIRRAEQLRIPFIVLHPGSHGGAGIDVGIARAARALDRIFDATPDCSAGIALETTAGQGNGIGYRFEQLAAIIAASRHPERLGVCLDTCHMFAAGYDLRTKKAYTGTMQALTTALPKAKIWAIHLNDSKKELGSRVDRHEHIGKGKIGRAAFGYFMNDPALRNVPKVLETPKGPDLQEDRVNLRLLQGLIEKGGKK